MNLDSLKNTFTKERHGELMIGSGGAILIAVMASLLDPETLKLLDAPAPIPSQLAKVLVWSAAILGGAYLIFKGLNRIDQARAANNAQHNAPLPIGIPPDTANSLTIQIQHGNTHISINIQPEKTNE